jgi:hypothetical protein
MQRVEIKQGSALAFCRQGASTHVQDLKSPLPNLGLGQSRNERALLLPHLSRTTSRVVVTYAEKEPTAVAAIAVITSLDLRVRLEQASSSIE